MEKRIYDVVRRGGGIMGAPRLQSHKRDQSSRWLWSKEIQPTKGIHDPFHANIRIPVQPQQNVQVSSMPLRCSIDSKKRWR